jgi:hypothetical protein
MRIRLGFVSNSSSCSFLIYGLRLAKDEDLERFKDLTSEFSVFSNPNDDVIYIGSSLEYCKDDETMGEFKKRVREILGEDNGKCQIYEDSWYDG